MANDIKKLTGQTRYRLNWRGKLILQVEFWVKKFYPRPLPGEGVGYVCSDWCDATALDVLAIERGEVERDKPSFWPRPSNVNPPPTYPKPSPPMAAPRPARRPG